MMLSVLDHGAVIPWLGAIAKIIDAPLAKKKSIWSRPAAGDAADTAAGGAAASKLHEPSYALERAFGSPVHTLAASIRTTQRWGFRVESPTPPRHPSLPSLHHPSINTTGSTFQHVLPQYCASTALVLP